MANMLAFGHAHLWLLDLRGLPNGFEQRCLALLDPEERRRADRFRVAGARLQFCAGRALCRTLLGHYGHVAPERWRFETNDHGRPRAVGPNGRPGPEFNVSHTEGLAACVLGATPELGVDVESLQRHVSPKLASSFFAPTEVRELETHPYEAQTHRFFEYWTLKEAYIKARGLGLSLPLDSFWFSLGTADEVRITMDTRCDDSPEGWQFRRWTHGAHHMVAIALRSAAPLTIQVMTLSDLSISL